MPDELRNFVARRTKEMNHATPTEYIRSLVREDQKRADQEKLEKLLLQSLSSGKPIVVNDVNEYFERKKRELLKRVKQDATKSRNTSR